MSSASSKKDPISLFISSLRLDQFCNVASGLRGGMRCEPGKHTVGGFNLVQELIFSDGTTWLARIPIPDNAFLPDECLLSYVAVLKYVKQNSRIPVPQIYHHALQSDLGNPTGSSYIFMERLPGHELPTLEPDEHDDGDGSWEEPSAEALRITRRVHEQLTDIFIDLASLTFDKIGSLREDPQGRFLVTEYIDPNSTARPKERAVVFKSLESCDRGPFSTVTSFYHAQCVLGKEHAQINPEEEDIGETVEDFETLDVMIPKFRINDYENGPFVVAHNDLTVQNILVDDEFNITGIIDFPGTIVPVQSLCVYPWLFHENYIGPVADRDLFYEIFTTRETSNQSSVLGSKRVRQNLLESSHNRGLFERSLEGLYTPVTLPLVYEAVYGKPYRGTGVTHDDTSRS